MVRRTRDLHRAKRRKVPFPVVAIVGYTNAGKSTLFNRLTGAGVLAQDMLFATLDPTLRRVRLPHGTPVILSDTVGFISDLPTHLVAAFRATLEEVVEADLVLHLRDIADPDTTAQAEDVERILGDLGVDAKDMDRIVEVWNKIDRLSPEAREEIGHVAGREHARNAGGRGAAVDARANAQVAVLHVELAIEQLRVRRMADGDEHTHQRNLARAAVVDMTDAHAGDAGFVAQDFVECVVPDQFDLAGRGFLEQLVLHDLLGLELVAAMHQRNLAADVRQV